MANVDPVRPFRTIHNVNYIEPKPNLHTELDTLPPSSPFYEFAAALALQKYYFVRQKFRRA